MSVLSRYGGNGGGDRGVTALASAAARVPQAYTNQVETVQRRRPWQLTIRRVAHGQIDEGGKALIDSVNQKKN
jgi:hypothetical protein